MAQYSFYCSACKENFQVRQSIHSNLPVNCTKCGAPEIVQCFPNIKTRTCTGFAVMERCENLAKQDMKKLIKGDDKALSDLVGDKPNSLKNK